MVTHFLQGLIAAVLVAMASAADFSHQLHLKLKPDCLGCHPKAATSSKLEDSLLPDGQLCQQCHKDSTIKQPRVLRLKKFDHSLHLRMGNIAPILLAAVKAKTYLADTASELAGHLEASKSACTSCHRGLEASAAVTRDHFPLMADCLVCHNKIDPPFSCEGCHGLDKTLKPAAHTNDYLDTHTKKAMEKVGCSNCHGRKFTCLGCH